MTCSTWQASLMTWPWAACFHQDTNPAGEVLQPGYLYEVKNIPDFNKISDTRVEMVGIIKI